MLDAVAKKVRLEHLQVLSPHSLYRKRKGKKTFLEELKPDEALQELNREEVLRLNRLHTRFGKQEIVSFIEDRMQDGVLEVKKGFVRDEADFEKLILAYDASFRKDSPFYVKRLEAEIEDEKYRYPGMVFYRRFYD